MPEQRLGPSSEGGMRTREAMVEFGRRSQEAGVEVVVIAGPHGFRVDGAVCLADVARGAGRLAWQDREIEMNIPVDGQLTDAIAARARDHGVPIAMGGFAGNRRYRSSIPLDWGIITT